MTTYYADGWNTLSYKVPVPLVNSPTTVMVPYLYTVPVGLALVEGDQIALAQVPSAARVVAWSFTLSNGLDDGNGIDGDIGLFIAGGAIFSHNSGDLAGAIVLWTYSGGSVDTAVPTDELAVDDVFGLTVTVDASGTAPAGTIKGFVQYVVRPIALR